MRGRRSSGNPSAIAAVGSALVLLSTFVETDVKDRSNDTPFWIMSVDPTVIKDHGDIWNVSFVEMLAQLMAPRGFFEPEYFRVQLRAAGGPSR